VVVFAEVAWPVPSLVVTPFTDNKISGF
jgi:hypothetical protein